MRRALVSPLGGRWTSARSSSGACERQLIGQLERSLDERMSPGMKRSGRASVLAGCGTTERPIR
jgi:hypothetical protein